MKESTELSKQLISDNNDSIALTPKLCEQDTKFLYSSSSLLSRLFFFWSYLTIKSPITLFSSYTAKLPSFPLHNFNKDVSSMSIMFSIFKLHKANIIKVILLSLFTVICENVQFISLRYLMLSFTSSDHSKVLYGIVFIISRLLYSFSNRHEKFNSIVLSTNISNQLTSTIYQKVMTLYDKSSNSLIGKIINYIQFDAENISFLFNYGPASLVVPIQTTISFYVIYTFCNKDFVVILLLIIILCIVFISGYLIQKFYYTKHGLYLDSKDKRVKITSDTFNMIREIKLNRYEEVFYNKIIKKRKNELVYLNDILDQGIVNYFVFFTIPIIMAMVIFTYMIYFNDPNFIFSISNLVTISLVLNALSYPLYRFPVFITCIAEAKVSLNRIVPFINSKDNSNRINTSHYTSILENNRTMCITGTLASGKSTLINNLLFHYGKVSFTSQEHFIVNDSIRENITFGEKFNEERYKEVIRMSGLEKDIEMFEEGDGKICGQNGSYLSGGQKARVDIARALYKDVDVYLFDDPFASLDDKVTKEVFDKAIKGLISEGKKVVIALSNGSAIESELDSFDYFVYLDKGNCKFEGDYNQFKHSHIYEQVVSKIQSYDKEANDTDIIKKKETKDKNIKEKVTINDNKHPHTMKFKSLIHYIGIFSTLGLIIFPLSFELSELYRNYFIANPSIEKGSSIESIRLHFQDYNLISLSSMLFHVLQEFTLYATTYYLNIKIHNQMLISLLKSPLIPFHSSVSNSEKINHLNKDLEKLRQPLKYYTYTLKCVLSLLITILISAYFSLYTLIPLPFISLLSILILKLYIKKTLLFIRAERESKSPIISSCNEALNGSLYIKCYKRENFFMSLLNRKLNHVLVCSLLNAGGQSWFGLTTELFGVLYIASIVTLCIVFNDRMNNTGLIVVYSLNTITNILNVMENYSIYVTTKIPFDRCDEYIKLPSEVDNDKKHIKAYYENGIEFKNVSMKYDINSNNVLHNITFDIEPSMRVAIVGRTGSGKSSLINSLLRVVPSSYITGRISIGTVDINSLNINALRENISFVSQTPFIYDGSLRDNVDPKFVYDDTELIEEITKMKFMNELIVKFYNGDVNRKVKAAMMSSGEKQLMCLCRAMLKKNKILVLDEATANVDLNTERIIYDSIDSLCKGKIIISIMHKKEYLSRFDKVITLEEGRIIN